MNQQFPPTVMAEEPNLSWVSLLLGLMLVLTPALGVPGQEMLQDTLKSMLVCGFTLTAAIILVASAKSTQLRWHPVVLLPLSLAAYAMGSMMWSHTYLAAIEAMRWSIFTLLCWLAMNTTRMNQGNRVIWGMHWGVTVASIWTAAQFWTDFQGFPQGPQPASTFVNRNFFAEYAVCAVPFSVFLISKAKTRLEAIFLAALTAFNVTTILMTGSRTAILTLVVMVPCSLIYTFWFRRHHESHPDGNASNKYVLATFISCLIVFGFIPCGNLSLQKETGAQGALLRATMRVAALQIEQRNALNSVTMRGDLWRATLKMAQANPVFGVGAGSWEVQIPKYQNPDTQLEIDYYAHNEPLQLVAEYGGLGMAFLVALLTFLVRSGWQIVRYSDASSQGRQDLQFAGLCSISALLLVSTTGFAWRLAGSGALFALGIGVLAATEVREREGRFFGTTFTLSKSASIVLALALLSCSTLYAVASYRAIVAERNLVRSLQSALSLSRVRDKETSTWKAQWQEAVQSARVGISANPHYRKISAEIGDAFAKEGDWKNALWVWESVAESRPYVVTILCNISRAHLELGNQSDSDAFFKRAHELKPEAPAVHSLAVYREVQRGDYPLANQLVASYLKLHPLDPFLVQLAYQIGNQLGDWSLVLEALQKLIQLQPSNATAAWLHIGGIYADQTKGNSETLARQAYLSALTTVRLEERHHILAVIPPKFRP